jgi:hypothetical protein
MKTRIDRMGGMLAAILLLALTLSALFASTAFAAQSTPAAGTQGRGGVAVAASATASGTSAAASTAAVRGAVGAPLGGTRAFVGRGRVPLRAAASTGSSGWAIIGVTFAAVLLGIFAYWAVSRRSRRAGEVASATSIGEASAARASSQTQESERRAA